MKQKSIRAVLVAIISSVAIAGSLSLSGCNTMEGVGEDVEDLGNAIEEGAREHS